LARARDAEADVAAGTALPAIAQIRLPRRCGSLAKHAKTAKASEAFPKEAEEPSRQFFPECTTAPRGFVRLCVLGGFA
jgi:hypothetical protein